MRAFEHGDVVVAAISQPHRGTQSGGSGADYHDPLGHDASAAVPVGPANVGRPGGRNDIDDFLSKDLTLSPDRLIRDDGAEPISAPATFSIAKNSCTTRI
ncbi:hypothetical protein [Mycobacterium ulcerans]|uniref:Uncharacterized protein n=1 Tax=Mycobacterium ulcerans str. Harvey TaxID=1299332 RepID=A0ABP3AQH7_MYCUL|nr:hypothetical protein [Mycobacterium ulcerans]EUA92160.1 hypothetical protein I551_1327 [Mycobacterium ulcerans str. Harvey]MEB4004234.1 hypothetical protein [Mycobacterium ulcerans]MEB4132436.1 hypothetical protein [Mycobacterium ulcerans]MEB4157279.1 hypothetical protein [Mycobacterium ulcerans]MEB4220214.1 hypothetical protein [Mycobacterium ulcerans]